VLVLTLILVTATLSGCGSRLDSQAIISALASSRPAPAQAVTASAGQVTVSAPAPSPAATIPEAPRKAATSKATKPLAAGDQSISAPASDGSAGSSGAGRAADRTVGSTAAGTVQGSQIRSTLVFGNIGPYSGVLGETLGGNKYGLSAWVAMQNARGGLDGHPIKLIVGDDQGDPVTSLNLMKRMVESNHVIAFVADIHGFGFDQDADYAASKGVPFIGGDGTDPRWYKDPEAFPSVPPAASLVVSTLRYFANSGTQRLGLLYCLEVAKICTYINNTVMKSAVGKYVVDDEQISIVAPSYTSQCLRMQAAKVEAVFLLMDTAAAARVVQNCATQGYRPKVGVLGLDASPDYPKVDAMAGSYIPGSTVPLSETQVPAVAQYRAAMDKYAPGIADSGAAGLGWAGGLVLGLAGAHLPDKPTAADFEANLWQANNETFGGFTAPLTFRKGQPAVPSTCVFLWGVKDHKFYAPQGPRALC